MSHLFRQAWDLISTTEKPWRRTLLIYRFLVASHKKFPALEKAIRSVDKRLRNMVESYPELAPRYLNQFKRFSSKKEAQCLANIFFERQPDNPELMVYLANYWYGEKAAKRGDELLTRAKEIAPNLAMIYEEEAASQRWRNNFSRELDALNRLASLYNKDDVAYIRTMNHLAFLQYRMRNYVKADSLYQRYLDKELSLQNCLAALRSAQASGDESRSQELQKLILSQSHVDLYSEIDFVREYIKLQDYEAAHFMLQKASDKGLGDRAEYKHRYVQLAWYENRWDDAIEMIQRMLLEHESLPSHWHLDYAEIAEAQGDLDFALKLLEESALEDETTFHLHYRRGMILRAQSKFIDAWMAFDLAGKALPFSHDDEPSYSKIIKSSLCSISPEEALSYLYSVSSRKNIAIQSYQIAKYLAAKEEFVMACDAAVRMSRGKVPGFPRFEKTASFKSRESRNVFEQFSEILDSLSINNSIAVYESFHGTSTACNPLALCLHALHDPKFSHIHHVWIVKPGTKIDERLVNNPKVTFVTRGSEGSILALATAKYVINNTSLPAWYFRRDGQHYLNTWHGIPWKHLGKRVSSEPFAYGNIARNLLNASHIIAPDEHTLDVLLEDQNVKTLINPASTRVTGYPRTDLTLNLVEERIQQIRSLLGVKPGQRIILYAPTWRGNVDSISQDLHFFYDTINELNKTGAFLAVRAHYFMESQLESMHNIPGAVVPPEINSNELLAVVDVLVTDYSSIMFDFLPTARPLIKFIPDFEQYRSTRGMYFAPDQVPGITVTSHEQLLPAVKEALSSPRDQNMHRKYQYFFSNEDGSASARVWEFLCEPIAPTDSHAERRALFMTNSFNPNGITRSLANATSFLSSTEVKTYVAVPNAAIDFADPALLDELATHSKILPISGGHTGTALQNWARSHMLQGKVDLTPRLRTLIKNAERLEARRRFGETKFDTIIDFDGYSPQLTMFAALQKPTLANKNILWLHSVMTEEQKIKFPWLITSFSWYNEFDTLVSVSNGSLKQNRTELSENFSVSAVKHATVENLLLPDRVLELSKKALSDQASFWLQGEERTVLTVGRFAPEKNQISIIEAISQVKEDLQGIKFGFLGSGPQEAYVRELVLRHGLEDKVTFLGYDPNPYPLMKSVDLVLQASLHEGQGLALLEALTLGTAVYASDIPPFHDVLGGGLYGKLFEPSRQGIADALRAFASTENLPTNSFDAHQYEREAEEQLFNVLLED